LSPWAKVRVVGEILATYPRLYRAMRREEIRDVVARIRAEPVEAAEPLPRLARVQLGGAVIRVLGLLPTDSRCLIRSLVLLSLLHRRGVESTLVIGVGVEPQFAAHAWIECEGETLLPWGNGTYERLTEV
jgi:Transglutaminase-like superfamily